MLSSRSEGENSTAICASSVLTLHPLQYHEQLAWVNHILHRPTFDAEVDYYYKLVDEGRQLDTCPVWLALYFMVSRLYISTIAR